MGTVRSRGLGLLFVYILMILLAIYPASCTDVTRSGISKDITENSNFDLIIKDKPCTLDIKDINSQYLKFELCQKDYELDPHITQKLDLDNDYIYDIIMEYIPSSFNKGTINLRLTFDVYTKISQEPIIEPVKNNDKETDISEYDPKTEEIIEESKDNKELIEKLSQEAGIDIEQEVEFKEEENKENISKEDTKPDIIDTPNWQNIKDMMKKIFSPLFINRSNMSDDSQKDPKTKDTQTTTSEITPTTDNTLTTNNTSTDNNTLTAPDFNDFKKELSSFFEKIKDLPYISYILLGLIILFILITIIHFSTQKQKKPLADRFVDLFLEEENKDKDDNKKDQNTKKTEKSASKKSKSSKKKKRSSKK